MAVVLAVVVGVVTPAASARPDHRPDGPAGGARVEAPTRQDDCPTYWVIGARGSGERRDHDQDAGPTVDSYVDRAMPLLPAAETEMVSLPYAAVAPEVDPFGYDQSVQDGWIGLQAVIRGRVSQCPGIRIGLIGFSQGAQVINEALNWLATHDTAALDAVRSVLTIADPLSDPSAPYHLGITLDGLPATRELDGGVLGHQRYPKGADRATDFCIQTDPICDNVTGGFEQLLRFITFPLHIEGYVNCCTEFFFPSILGGIFARRLLEPPPNRAPRIAADADDITVPEGGTARNGGTVVDAEGHAITMSASVGTVTLSGDRWSWELPNAGQGSQTVTITAEDSEGASSSITFTLNGSNAPPSVSIDPNQVTTIDEGDRLTATARFTDAPGDGPFTGRIGWGFGPDTVGLVGGGTLRGDRQYGDNGAFDVTMSVTDREGNTGSDSFGLTVNNLSPEAVIDRTGTVTVNGQMVFLGRVGDPFTFEGRSTDPGSDDLTLTWDWDDGPPAPDVSTTHLVNPPDPDPLPSPSVQPRDVSESQDQAWTEPCLYDVRFASADDDGGSGDDTVPVIVTGDVDHRSGPGYWFNQYRPGQRNDNDLTDERLTCYLEIVRLASGVFDERRPLPDLAAAHELLDGPGPDPQDRLDRELLTAWLNFANGALTLDEVVAIENGTA